MLLHEFTTADVVTIHVTNSSNQKYLITQIYRPPDKNMEFLNELEQFISKVNTLNITSYISGDFNIDLFSISSTPFNETFFSTMCSYGYLPTISKATRVAATSTTLLDNIFCNDISKIATTGIILTDFSDHFSIFAATTDLREKPVNTKRTKTTFSYKHIDRFKDFIATKLNDLNLEQDPEQACERIINAYSEGISLFSYTHISSRRTSFIKPWMTQGILNSINHKSRLFSIKIKHPSSANVTNYNNFRNCLNRTITNAKKLYYQNEFSKHQHNPKKTWETIHKILNSKTKQNTVPCKMTDDTGKELNDSSEIAEGFNKFFTEVGLTQTKNTK